VGSDGNADEDLIIFVKTQQMLLNALLHIFILLLLKKSVLIGCDYGRQTVTLGLLA
jgi:hypothetical protein